MSTAGCHYCGQPGAFGWRYALPAASAEGARIDHCLRCATRHPALVGRASRVALVVGTVLTAINQGDAIVSGHATAELLWKIPLTYLVPYLVSTYSTLGAVRTRPEATNAPLVGVPIRAREAPMADETRGSVTPGRDRGAALTGGVVLVVAAVAWAVVVLQALGMRQLGEPAAPMPGMASPETPGGMGMGMPGSSGAVSPVDALTYLGAWGVMMAAMMLPSAAPMIALYGTIRRRFAPGGQRLLPTALFAGTYLAVWLLFGLPVYLASVAVSAAAMANPTVAARLPYVLAAVLVAAGGYQFTALKRVCLRTCQHPLSFLMSRWRAGYAGMLKTGLAHAAYCVGCCWGLMVVLVAAGAMGLLWVVLIALVVLAEKLGPRGEWTARVVGAALILLGLVVAVQPGLAAALRG